MTTMIRSFAFVAALALGGMAFATTDQPYAGQENREISSLSAQDVEDLLAGRGWGFAKPAELNGYPGPAHVLELAEELELSEEQAAGIEAVRVQMEAEAQALGAEYVAAEAALDAAFAGGALDAAELERLTGEASRVEAALRATHLAAHLEIKPLLTRHQVITYNRLRGYGDGGHGGGHGQH